MPKISIPSDLSAHILGMQFSAEQPTGVISEQLDARTYPKVSRILQAYGGIWSRKHSAFVFPDHASIERLIEAAESGVYSRPATEQQTLQAYFTPPAVVSRILQAARIEAGMRVLEPSAGHGALASAASERGAVVTAYDLHFPFVDVLRRQGLAAHAADFLDVPAAPDFDRVLMNPPFTQGQDLLHVSHALKFLRPGGRLVAVMAGGVTYRKTAAFTLFRALIEARGGQIESLPPASFHVSGTDFYTALLVVDAAA